MSQLKIRWSHPSEDKENKTKEANQQSKEDSQTLTLPKNTHSVSAKELKSSLKESSVGHVTYEFFDSDNDSEHDPEKVQQELAKTYTFTGNIGDDVSYDDIDSIKIPDGFEITNEDSSGLQIYNHIGRGQYSDWDVPITIYLRHKTTPLDITKLPKNIQDQVEVTRTYNIYITPPSAKYGKRYLSAIWKPVFTRDVSTDDITGQMVIGDTWNINSDLSKIIDQTPGQDWDPDTAGQPSNTIDLTGYFLCDSKQDKQYYRNAKELTDGTFVANGETYDHGLVIQGTGASIRTDFTLYKIDREGSSASLEATDNMMSIKDLKPSGNIELHFVANDEYDGSATIVDGSVNTSNNPNQEHDYVNSFGDYWWMAGMTDAEHAAIFGTFDNPKFDMAKFRAFVKANSVKNSDGTYTFTDPGSNSVCHLDFNSYQDYQYDNNGKIVKNSDGEPNIVTGNQITPDWLDNYELKDDSSYLLSAGNIHLTKEQAAKAGMSEWNKNKWWTQWAFGPNALRFVPGHENDECAFIVLVPKTNKQIVKTVQPSYEIDAQMPDGSTSTIVDFKPVFELVNLSNAVTGRALGQEWELVSTSAKSLTFNPHKSGYSDNWNNILTAIKAYGLNVNGSSNGYILATVLANKNLKGNKWTLVYTALPASTVNSNDSSGQRQSATDTNNDSSKQTQLNSKASSNLRRKSAKTKEVSKVNRTKRSSKSIKSQLKTRANKSKQAEKNRSINETKLMFGQKQSNDFTQTNTKGKAVIAQQQDSIKPVQLSAKAKAITNSKVANETNKHSAKTNASAKSKSHSSARSNKATNNSQPRRIFQKGKSNSKGNNKLIAVCGAVCGLALTGSAGLFAWHKKHI